jgi:hypothetical protein
MKPHRTRMRYQKVALLGAAMLASFALLAASARYYTCALTVHQDP